MAADPDFLRRQLREELQRLTLLCLQVRNDTWKCHSSRMSLDCLAEGRAILVPLTRSLHVWGRMVETNRVIVGIGTGYYLSQTCEQARLVIDRKQASLQLLLHLTTSLLTQRQLALEALQTPLTHNGSFVYSQSSYSLGTYESSWSSCRLTWASSSSPEES